MRLNTAGTVEECKKAGACGVFLAVGGNPIAPPIPGHEKAVLAEQILAGEVKLTGKTIAVIGGGVTGLETAEYLSADNKVTVVEMQNAVGTTLYPSVLHFLKERLDKNGAEIFDRPCH